MEHVKVFQVTNLMHTSFIL